VNTRTLLLDALADPHVRLLEVDVRDDGAGRVVAAHEPQDVPGAITFEEWVKIVRSSNYLKHSDEVHLCS
jgi:hypothetical protein